MPDTPSLDGHAVRTRRTRARVLAESLALFNERGEANVTTGAIAAALGISRAISTTTSATRTRSWRSCSAISRRASASSRAFPRMPPRRSRTCGSTCTSCSRRSGSTVSYGQGAYQVMALFAPYLQGDARRHFDRLAASYVE